MKYKALITDLDGSAVKLSSDGSDVDLLTREAVREAEQQGYIIAAATGRDWDLTQPVVAALGLTAPCVFSGGSAIIDPVTEEILWERPLTPRTPTRILNVFKKHASTGIAYVPGNTIPLDELHEVPDELRFLYLVAVRAKEAHAIAKEINTESYAIAHMTPSWYGQGMIDIHVTHPDATKEHAVKAWHNLTGIAVEETIAMGDSGNDLPLFRAASLRVATGNATPEIKEIADYIAPDASDHALKHVIEKFLLSQK